MPLSERARVEVYLPDLPRAVYQDLLSELSTEFTFTFGGCTTIRGLEGSYLSQANLRIQDRISLIYTDTPYSFGDNFVTVSEYADALKAAVITALDEEAILITVAKVHHVE